MPELSPNTNLTHYRIVSKIGAGGMGEVYLAEDTRLERRIALKFLPAAFALDETRLKRFTQEACAASALNHPNILTVHEIGQTDDWHFIATEFVEGVSLREWMTREPIELGEVLEISVQIASALAAAHDAGIIHRDIKPENVMVRGDGYIKVLDFGLAKLTKQQSVGSESPTLIGTLPGVVMGTVSYMSPEQARGAQVDVRTDIWSLGCVLYEMVARKMPFEGATASDMIASVLKSEPVPVQNFRSETPAELDRIIAKTLAKERGERYQTAKDLLVDLRRLKKQIEIGAELERTASANKLSIPPSENRTQILATVPTSSAEYVISEIRNHKRGFLTALSLLLFTVIGFGYWFFAHRSPNAVQIQSIAVLPFVNESGNADNEYLSDGMTESLISSLSQLPNLSVKARSSVFRYKGRDVNPQTIGNELSVQAVLLGRMVQRGEELKLGLELVDVRTENVIWSEQYNRKQIDLISLQSEIARDVTHKLRGRLSGAEKQRVTKNYTANTEAYQLYLKGRFYWNKRTGEALKKSIEYFNLAIEKDPSYALAYAGLADTYVVFPAYGVSPPQEAYPKAIAAAKRALELDETLAQAHTSLGYALIMYDCNLSESTREFQRAMELNPNYATLHHWYPSVFQVTGRMDDAIAGMKRAQELDPLSLGINTALGRAYYLARQYDKAIEQLRKTIEMDQNFYYAQWMLGLAYEMKGSLPEAIAEYQKARQLNDDPFVLALLGHAFAASGKRDDALRTLDQLKELSKQRYVSSYSFAIIHAGLGEKDQAFQWLEKGYQSRDIDMPFLRFNPLFDNLRSDPRFQDLVRCVGLTP